MSKVGNYGLIILTPPINPKRISKYPKNRAYREGLVHTAYPYNQGKRKKPSGKILP